MILLKKLNRSEPFPGATAIWGFLTRQNYIAILLIVLVIAAIRLPIDYKRMMTNTDNDYIDHIYYALNMLHHKPVPNYVLAHPLWELALMGIWWLSRCRIDFWQSAIGIQALSSIVSTLMIYFWFGTLPSRPAPWKRVFWAVTLAVVAPIALPTLLDGSYYFGYIGLANYHNPSVHVLRPFAILMFIFAIETLERKTHSFWHIPVAALTVIGATLLKPNLTITLLPALGLMVLFWLVKRKPIDWRLLILGLGIPALAVLIVQFIMSYGSGTPEAKIVFMPLAVARILSGYITIKFFLSILFPLIITGVFFKRFLRDDEMILAWLGFAVGAVQYFLLAEVPRLGHANFVWGAQIDLFVLFVVTTRFLLKQDFNIKSIANPKAWLPYLVYLPHIVAGIAYYIFCYVTPHYG